ncbi:MAG TPA: hypothetical protein DCY88_22835 [Cyanobacteria bacterium UBA11372]|nr:hypothetical protein [Cyanobacteria bacterium UBA11372]
MFQSKYGFSLDATSLDSSAHFFLEAMWLFPAATFELNFSIELLSQARQGSFDTSNTPKTPGHLLLCELRFVKNMLQKSLLSGQEVCRAIMSTFTLL